MRLLVLAGVIAVAVNVGLVSRSGVANREV